MADKRVTRESIAQFRTKLIDGGWGTEFQKRGGRPGECFELWNRTRPGEVLDVARAYVAAGSDIILTNSFGASRFMLEAHGLAAEVTTTNRIAAEISRDAAGDRALVFGSIGPCGKMVGLGEVDEAKLRDSLAEQARGLADGGADALVLETMTDLAEVVVALQVLGEEVQIPYGVCMSFDAGPDKLHTMMGASPGALIEAAKAGGAAFVGANCGPGPEQYMSLAEVFGKATELPVWIKPNAGLPVVENGRIVYHTGPQEFAAFMPRFFAAGVRMLGGCCGTSPDFIGALRALVEGEGH